MCCASCKYKKYSDRVRRCLLDDGDVPSSYVCPNWDMSKTFENAGMGGGNVKDTDYLHYALDKLVEDSISANEALAKGDAYEKLSLGDLRKEYLEKNNSIYAIEE